MVIYKITNLLNGKVYIGQTIQEVSQRWKRHCKGNDKTAIAEAIKKYSKDNFKFEVIDTAETLEDLNKKEESWILKENSISPNGYNLNSGGLNRIPTEETKKILKEKALERNFGKWKREDKHLEANSRKGVEQFTDLVFKLNWAKSKGFKKILVYKADINKEPTEFVGEWYMSTECAKDLKVKPRSIRQCLIGKQKAHRGYIFIYGG